MTTCFSDRLDAIRSEGKKVLVVGLGATGVETARFLTTRGISVVCTEKQSESVFLEKSRFSQHIPSLKEQRVQFCFGIDGEGIKPYLSGVSLAVLSPGVPLESSIVSAISRAGISYVSELELGILLHRGKSVVVTGSNGKTTTASLIHHTLSLSGVSSSLCKNEGMPLLASIESNRGGESNANSVLVVEASSYQLEACTALKPSISVILNISENHLERHGSVERYAAAKAAVLRLQDKGDITILNGDDIVVRRLSSFCRGEVVFFGTGEIPNKFQKWIEISNPRSVNDDRSDTIVEQWPEPGVTEISRSIYSLKDCHLLGHHNRYNIAAAIAACRALDLTSEQISRGLSTFLPLEHRLQVLPLQGDTGVVVINDSKSTTVAASRAAYLTVQEHFKDRPIILMVGGLSKAGSWEPLLAEITKNKHHVAPVICFGKDASLIADHCRARGIATLVCSNLKEGVIASSIEATKVRGVILLSPGCASFDEFIDFEHRGREFVRLVTERLAERDIATHVTAKGEAV